MEHFSKALVLGLGDSGAAAARLLLSEGAKVEVVDRGDDDELRRRAAALTGAGAHVALGVAAPPPGDYSVCIVSPGIPSDSAWVASVAARGIPLLPEFELGWSRARCRGLAVSGSNGKSTLVKLCVNTLARAGLAAAAAGNYGPPVSQVVMAPARLDWLVLEVSSFQLETARAFRPDVGILLNVYPNHLDRHHDFVAYERIKAGLFARMTARDTGIVPDELTDRMPALAGSANRWISFGLSAAADFRYHAQFVRERSGAGRVALAGTIFENEVLGLTAAAAAAAMRACGVTGDRLEQAARCFERLPHRMQPAGAVGGVCFIDDSKATNLAALMAALKMAPAPVRLIAGGLPKCEPFAPAQTLLREKAVGVYLIGKAAGQMAAAWGAVVPCAMCGTLEAAVNSAWLQARAGDTILLSPACASFDQFSSFEERGEKFRAAIAGLPGGKKSA